MRSRRHSRLSCLAVRAQPPPPASPVASPSPRLRHGLLHRARAVAPRRTPPKTPRLQGARVVPPASPLLHQRRRHGPPVVAATATSKPVLKDPKKFQEWDSLTAKFAGAAKVPFFLLQLPQIVLKARNLLAGNKTALFAVSWLGMLTGLLGNLSLLSYFAKKKETEAVIVQTLGVISTYAVLVQLAMAESMPVPQFVATSVVVAAGLLLNFLNYFGWLPGTL